MSYAFFYRECDFFRINRRANSFLSFFQPVMIFFVWIRALFCGDIVVGVCVHNVNRVLLSVSVGSEHSMIVFPFLPVFVWGVRVGTLFKGRVSDLGSKRKIKR